MTQICKFNELPATINNGGYKKGHWIVWLNLGVYANVSSISKEGEDNWMYAAHTDRLVLSDNSIWGFLSVVEPTHLALATTEELISILRYFNAEEDLESWKALRKAQINGYDSSEKVNCFYLNNLQLWLDKATRVGLVNSINTEKSSGRLNTVLWFGNRKIEMGVDEALGALSQLELYALDCYNVTAQHRVIAENCQTIEELKELDIASDYPEMLQFSIKE